MHGLQGNDAPFKALVETLVVARTKQVALRCIATIKSASSRKALSDSTYYRPSPLEDYVFHHLSDLGLNETIHLYPTCSIFTNQSAAPAIYKDLIKYTEELENYNRVVSEFSIVPDVRLSFSNASTLQQKIKCLQSTRATHPSKASKGSFEVEGSRALLFSPRWTFWKDSHSAASRKKAATSRIVAFYELLVDLLSVKKKSQQVIKKNSGLEMHRRPCFTSDDEMTCIIL